MKKVKTGIGKIFYILLIVVFLWISVCNMVQAFKCPKMTYTELFLHLPKSVVLDWNSCE